MTKLASVAALATTALSLTLALTWTVQAGSGTQVPAQKNAEEARVTQPYLTLDAYPFLNDKERLKDFVYAEVGNMRPLIIDAKGARFQTRQGVLYKDGTVKLWNPQQKEPVAAPLQHKGPIRELTFFDEANLLITTSDDSVKVWDALTGELRKELPGQAVPPMWLSFAPGAKRFATMNTDGKVVTVWDATTLAPVAAVQSPSLGRVGASGLSGDGRTVVLFRFGTEASIELYDVGTGRTFATLRLPSRSAAEVFSEDGVGLNKGNLQPEAHFWEVVRSLAPGVEPKKSAK